MYEVVYVIDEHDRLYGGTRRKFADKEQALRFATIVESLGVYDEDGKPVVPDEPPKPKATKPKATSEESK